MTRGFKSTGVAIVELCSSSGAFDGFVQRGMELVESTLSISDKEVERWAQKIGILAAEYRKSGRLYPEICLGFQRGTLLIVWGNSGAVTLRFRGGVDRIETVIAECRTFLKQVLDDGEPEPVAIATVEPPVNEAWKRYEPRLINLLSGVVSRSQASRMIERVLASMEISGPVPDDMLAKFTRELLEKIPDRRKREALAAEARDEIENSLNP